MTLVDHGVEALVAEKGWAAVFPEPRAVHLEYRVHVQHHCLDVELRRNEHVKFIWVLLGSREQQDVGFHHRMKALDKKQLEQTISEILLLQLTELKQLDQTGNLGKIGLNELFTGQIEHLSGQADDWVWSTNQLTELLGSKPKIQEDISLDECMSACQAESKCLEKVKKTYLLNFNCGLWVYFCLEDLI